MNGPRRSSRSERERDWGGGCWDRATFTIFSCCVYLKETKCTESAFKKIPEWAIFAFFKKKKYILQWGLTLAHAWAVTTRLRIK